MKYEIIYYKVQYQRLVQSRDTSIYQPKYLSCTAHTEKQEDSWYSCDNR
jgi:hypothetical protein